MIASGSQLRAARAGLGWSQGELADRAGIHAKAVAYWERMGEVSRRQAQGWAPERMLAAPSGYAATGKAISGGFNFLGGLAGSGAFGSNIQGIF